MSLSSARCAFRTIIFRKPVTAVTFMTLQCHKVWPTRLLPDSAAFELKSIPVYCTSKRCLNLTALLRMSKNYYDVLGVPQNASAKQIKDAYFKLAMKHHPDKNQGVLTQRFRDIKEAYDILSNDSSRMNYNNNSTNNHGPFNTSASGDWTSNSSYGRYKSYNEQYSRTNGGFKYRNPNRKHTYSDLKTINVFINVIKVPQNIIKAQVDIMLLTFIKNRTLKIILFQIFQFLWTLVLKNLNFNILISTEFPDSTMGEFVRSILENKIVRVELTEIEAIKGKSIRVQVNDNEKVLIVNIPRGTKKNQSFYLFYLMDNDGSSVNFKI